MHFEVILIKNRDKKIFICKEKLRIIKLINRIIKMKLNL